MLEEPFAAALVHRRLVVFILHFRRLIEVALEPVPRQNRLVFMPLKIEILLFAETIHLRYHTCGAHCLCGDHVFDFAVQLADACALDPLLLRLGEPCDVTGGQKTRSSRWCRLNRQI